MSWNCPTCGRSFKNANQWHSCGKYAVEDKFIGKALIVKEMYDALVAQIKQYGTFDIDPVQNAILLKKKTTFIAFKPMKNGLDVEFSLEEEVEEYPVFKSLQASKNRWWHKVRLYGKEDISGQLLEWLQKAYDLEKG